MAYRVFLFALLVVATASQAFAERRVALVIGNSSYRHTAALQNLLVKNIAILVLTVLILAVLVSTLFGRSLKIKIESLNQAMHRMESGDLRGRLPVESRDEMAELSLHFNNMSDSLSLLVNSVKTNSL